MTARADLQPGAQTLTMARCRVLAWSAIGVGCLLAAQWGQPDQHVLFSPPTGPRSWLLLLCGLLGIWLVPGLWISAIVARTGGGQAAWLGTRIGTTLAWYALAAPVIHVLGEEASITTAGLLAATVAATSSAALGMVLGLFPRPRRTALRLLAAVGIGAVAAQAALWAAPRLWAEGMNHSHLHRLGWLIVLGCAALVACGAMSSPRVPPAPTLHRIWPIVVAATVTAVSAGLLLTAGANWSPEQRMRSALGVQQIAPPPGVDAAFAVSTMGPAGPALLQHADFVVTDETGQALVAETRLTAIDDSFNEAMLLVTVRPESVPDLCRTPDVEDPDLPPGARVVAVPVKATVRERGSGLRTQAIFPDGWCVR